MCWQKLVPSIQQGRLSKEEVDRMLHQAEAFKDQDKLNAEIFDWRTTLENKCM